MLATNRKRLRDLGLMLLGIGAAAVAGCSGGGFLPFDNGPHSMDQRRLNLIVNAQAAAHQVPATLVRAVISQESGGDPSAISTAGAMGLMQLMPSTASAYGVANAFDPDENVAGGVSYLHDLLLRYHGNVALALAAYNAGSGAVSRYKGIPPYAETQNYVSNVTALYRAASSKRSSR